MRAVKSDENRLPAAGYTVFDPDGFSLAYWVF